MKKIVKWFHNKKKFSSSSHDLAADAVPEAPRNLPRYVPKQINLYKSFKADNCCSSNNKTGNYDTDNIASEITEEPMIGNSNERNLVDLNSQPQHMSHEVVEIERPSLPGSMKDTPILPIVTSQTITVPDTLSVDSTESLSRAGSADNMAVQETDSTTNGLPTNCLPKKLFDDKKNGGNTYVITITKSTNFHIGTQKTINYPGAEDHSVHKKEFQYTNTNNGKLLALNANQILDNKDRLSEDDLVQISLSIHDKWQEFARNLGIDEATIDELKELNDNDYNFIVYDILKQYLGRYPNTSVGFMVNVLKKSDETEAIRKLMEKR